MKSSFLLLTLGLICVTPVALSQAAEEEDHSAHHPAAGEAAATAPPAEHDHDSGKPDPLQQNMQRIEGLMRQIHEADDPERKRALLGEHLQALLDQMKLIRSQGDGMKAAKKAPEGKDADMMGGMMKSGGMMKMHKKMEQRIDLLERLLQQTLEREAVEEVLDSR